MAGAALLTTLATKAAAALSTAQGIGTALGLAGTALGAADAIGRGQQAKATADFEAGQLKDKANEEAAISQRAAAEERRRTERLISRGRAVAAGSGAAVDGSVLDLFEDISEEGDLRARNRLFEGASAERSLTQSAAARRLEGSEARSNSFFEAGSSVLGGVSGLAKRFGQRSGTVRRFG